MDRQSLEAKLKELELFSMQNELDLTQEIEAIKKKLSAQIENQELTAWDKVQLARKQERPTTLDYIERIFDDYIELHGDRNFADDKAIIGAIATINGLSVTIIGHQKGRNTKENIERNFGMANPEGYRKALRLMKQAEKFNRPIITFIDTAGAYCGLGAEERGQGEAIALNLREMPRLKVPFIAIVIGEGGSGGALGLSMGDKIAMLENSIYSVISPEGLASILWKDASLCQKASEKMKLTAKELKDLNIIDDLIQEPKEGAHLNVDLVANNIKSYIVTNLEKLSKIPKEELVQKRYDKIRQKGIWGA